MIVGTTKELKNNEFRVGLTPDNVTDYVKHGHTVFVESHAGDGAGFSDSDYMKAGAVVVKTPQEVFEKSDMIVKVKEPEPQEYDLLRPGQILYTYLHLAANKALAEALIRNNVKAVAFETITDAKGGLPCLSPMSQIAGRLSIQEGSKYLETEFGGRGLLLSGVPGVQKGNVVVVGGGTAGTYAAKAAIGIGANVKVLDINLKRLAYLEDIFENAVDTIYSSDANIASALKDADLVIGSVLIPGDSTPKLVRREHLKLMKKGSVIVDIAIDQGGCCESSHVTTHSDPVFVEEGVVHYCVGNMPGAVPYTSTVALANATITNGLLIADNGLEEAMRINNGLATGLNIYGGVCVNKNVAHALDLDYVEIGSVKWGVLELANA